MGRRVSVHHFVATLTTRQYGPHPTSDLLGVDHVHVVPADTEFPRFLPRVDLFTRFYLRRAAPTDFLIRIEWRGASESRRPSRQRYGPFAVGFQPGDGVYDHAFRLVNVRLEGPGWYAVVLYRRKLTALGPRWGRLVETHWFVER